MKKVIERMFVSYLNDGFEKVISSNRQTSEKEQEFYKLWDKLNSELSIDEQNENFLLMSDADYDSELFAFTNAFRLGFMLCAEVFSNE